MAGDLVLGQRGQQLRRSGQRPTESAWARYSSVCQTRHGDVVAGQRRRSPSSATRTGAAHPDPPVDPPHRQVDGQRASAVPGDHMLVRCRSASRQVEQEGGRGRLRVAGRVATAQCGRRPITRRTATTPLMVPIRASGPTGRRGEVGRRAQPDLVPDVTGARVKLVQHPAFQSGTQTAPPPSRRALRRGGTAPAHADRVAGGVHGRHPPDARHVRRCLWLPSCRRRAHRCLGHPRAHAGEVAGVQQIPGAALASAKIIRCPGRRRSRGRRRKRCPRARWPGRRCPCAAGPG